MKSSASQSVSRKKLLITQIPVVGCLISLTGAFFPAVSFIQLVFVSLGLVLIAHGLVKMTKISIPSYSIPAEFNRNSLLLLVIIDCFFASEAFFSIIHNTAAAILLVLAITVCLATTGVYVLSKGHSLIKKQRSAKTYG